MTVKNISNLAASVPARLQNHARLEAAIPGAGPVLRDGALLAEFLLPIARACERGEAFEQRWSPGGPWTIGS